MRWVEDENYHYNGKLIPYQVATVVPCECQYDKMFKRYNPTETFSTEEKKHLFTTAETDQDNRPHFEIAADFVRHIEKYKEIGQWLYIFGDEKRAKELSDKTGRDYSAYGTGKTYLMQCIANALAHRKIPGIYVDEEKLFGDIKATYSKGSDDNEWDVLERYYRVPVLMIDDMFTAPYTDWSEGKLFSILDHRVNDKKITIMTSNYAVGRIHQLLPKNGGKIASRINGQARLVEMIGPDRRDRKKKGKTA
ncbi:ATP-binding protein [Paenibacillus alkalitolerans]|uniref:ATP-binding protein n=1 Tax=Paenibacillus alkalitolerans TaxID=2799335 RepID=UPI0018F43390|nr:ATP-binding protein [Paenibacillus alkalitolerans]